MITRLRTRHRRMFLGIAVIVPAVFVFGLLSRPDPILPSRLPGGLSNDGPAIPDVRTDYQVGVWNIPGIRLERWTTEPDRWNIRVVPDQPFPAPEALLYWVAEESGPGDVPSDSAHLLGSFGGLGPKSYRLPDRSHGRGWLILYSLGQAREIARASLEEFTRPEDPESPGRQNP